MEDMQQPSMEFASQACLSCRKQKRKCDKQLPACGLCQRIGRICDYSTDIQPSVPSPEDFAALQQQVAALQDLITLNHSSNSSNGYSTSSESLKLGLENGTPAQSLSTASSATWPGASTFSSLYFLDSNAFEYGHFQIHMPYLKVPPGALTALGSSTELREMIERYFATVHPYLPIISKIRLYQHLANPLHEPGADIALLFLAMKLTCSTIPENSPPQTQLYQDVKSFYHYVEAQNGFSVQMIQALLLIALYETAHSIYPAAYLTIGNAARVGCASGLHDRKAPQILPRPTTWTEQEERRRLWWGVVILDRFINIGHRGKPLATTAPNLETILPCEDAAWDIGQMLAAAPLALSASQTIRVSPYARTCQATHLLGKIVNHLDDKDLSMDYRFKEALQLHRTVRAFADVLSGEASEDVEEGPITRSPMWPSIAITYSGLLTLYDSYSCTAGFPHSGDDQQLVMQKESIDGLREISDKAFQLARQVGDVVSNGGLDQLSPMVIDSVYQAAANCKSADHTMGIMSELGYYINVLTKAENALDCWYVRESSYQTCVERLVELKQLLMRIDKRWKVAGEFDWLHEAVYDA